MSFLGSLVSGVFGLFGKKKQSTETTVNYQKMAASATAAGFNPLTALRNGGSAGFTTTTGPTTSQLPEALGNLGGILGDALEDKLDPIKAKKRELDTALVDAQLRQLKQGPQVVGSFKPAREFLGTKVSQQLVPRLGAVSHKQTASVPAGVNKPGAGSIVGGDNPTVSSMGLNNGRYGWFQAPWMTDANQFENIYGDNEIGSTLYGAAKFGADGLYTAYRNISAASEDYLPARMPGGSKHRYRAPAKYSYPVTIRKKALSTR